VILNELFIVSKFHLGNFVAFAVQRSGLCATLRVLVSRSQIPFGNAFVQREAKRDTKISKTLMISIIYKIYNANFIT
jgi:hypothetical protein